jgi:type I restriction-modification system DNA methylase subunit
MTVSEYLIKLNARYRSGISTEHSYRAELLGLIEALVLGITITNEPKRVACGAPDYIITRRNIPVGYIEAKDIGADLYSKAYKEQFDRYKQSLDNLIITDYLTFQFFVNGSATTSIIIGEISGNQIHPITDNFERFISLIKNFCEFTGQTIKSAQKLSKMMAAKAKLMANVIELALDPKNENEGVNELQNINLLSQYDTFKQVLIHDITPKAFADIYAQTIAYGMFAARLNDPSLENFTRQEAAVLIPKSNPFLRKLFQYIAGYDLDDRIVWIVDALADIFRATNVEEMLKDFGKPTHQTDPFIHFYETFLADYDPKLRKSRGVWYTPEPVVNFIVRAVDDILKADFGLSQGLADTSKIKIKVPGQEKKPIEKEVHRVQILDPAAGTGTFLAEVIKQIHHKFEGQQGIWSQYVEDHLIPRLNGFEILMASYAMAHLKLEMLLKETGYIPTRDQRLRVYLTNSLEEHHPDTGTLFASWLSSEANEASHVKRDTPVMVVLGNPPYSVSSSNKGEWIQTLIKDYKENLNEKKINLDDDYIKFLRYGQFLIEKNGEGILAFISNNSFIDGVTHRQMRKSLIESFDKIYIIDLHGSLKKKETDTEGGKDENVFDIQQGVSINIFVKTGKKPKYSRSSVYHSDVFGTRAFKYEKLFNSSIDLTQFQSINYSKPYHFFVSKDFSLQSEYDNFISIADLFIEIGSGVKTERDRVCIHFSKKELIETINNFTDKSETDLRSLYKLGEDSRDWKLKSAIHDVRINLKKNLHIQYDYRPFDTRWTFYTGQSRGFIGTPGPKRAFQLINRDNISIVVCRQQSTFNFQHTLISKNPSDICFLSSQTKETSYIIPLYIYKSEDDIFHDLERAPNLNPQYIQRFSSSLGLTFCPEKGSLQNCFTPIDIIDYIYAVLHSSSYRKKYKEFLKIDFPRIPYPEDLVTLWELVNLGTELRQIHLLESPIVDKYITTYPINGSNEVTKLQYKDGQVWINNEQCFDNVPLKAWEFYIGGYQPAQKWLKDRKGRVLSFDDIMHYQKIIVALTETDRIMKEIDKIDFLP